MRHTDGENVSGAFVQKILKGALLGALARYIRHIAAYAQDLKAHRLADAGQNSDFPRLSRVDAEGAFLARHDAGHAVQRNDEVVLHITAGGGGL